MITGGQRRAVVLLGLLLIEIAHSSSCTLCSPSCLDRDGVSINNPDQLDSHSQQLFEPPISTATPRDSAPHADQVQQLAPQLHSLTLIFTALVPDIRCQAHSGRCTTPPGRPHQ